MLRSEKWTRDRAFHILSDSVGIGLRGCCLPLLLVGMPLLAQDAPLQQGPPLKVSVNRVNVGVTVSDAGGRFIHVHAIHAHSRGNDGRSSNDTQQSKYLDAAEHANEQQELIQVRSIAQK